MKRKTFTWSSLTVLFFAACMVAACSGDEGEPGPAGTNGTDGKDGKDVAYDEAISKGNVLLILDGTRPDGIAFKDTIDFRFATADWNTSSLYRNDAPTDDYNQVSLRRRQSIDMQFGEGEYGVLNAYSEGYLEGGEEGVYSNVTAYYPTIAFPQEKKYFQLYASFWFQRYFDSEAGEFVEPGTLVDGAVTSYKRIVGADGKFSYKINGTVPAGDNNTGYDLKVTVIADALVYEQLQNNSDKNNGRIGSSKSNGRTAPAIEKVAKAEMQSMK